MLKKFLYLFLVLGLVSACSSTPEGEEYDVLDGQSQANKMNQSGMIEEVEVSDKVYFAFDQYNISEKSAMVLDLQVEWLKAEKKVKVMIEGHADERGTKEYNLALGNRRANAVKEYLVSKGIQASRIQTISYGKEKPVFFGTGPEVWAKNRVAITVEIK